MKRISFYEPEIGKKESLYALDAIRDKDFSRGKYIGKFTDALQERIGSQYASLCSSGSTGCHLVMLGLGIKEGDEVIIPLTYVATANAVKYCGATPVFCDVYHDTWNINVELAKDLVTDRTKAIFYVDLLGNPADIRGLRQLQREKNHIFLAGDCAQSLGSVYNNIEACCLPDVSVTSFYGSKIITSGGEGGCVFTDDDIVYNRVEHYKGQAQTKQYWHDKVGYNYRMSNIHAAIGHAQLSNLDKILEKKKQICEWYKGLLEGYPVIFQYIPKENTSNNWVVAAKFRNKHETDKVKKILTNYGIEWRRMFYPLNMFPMYKDCTTSDMEVSYHLTDSIILLPSHSLLTFEQIKYICDGIKRNF